MKKGELLVLFSFYLLTSEFLLGQAVQSTRLDHTYSIVARDPISGEIGVAVQTHWFAVGTRVAWAEAGVGAIATQSFTNPSFGPRGLELLKQGKSPQEVVDELIASDEGRNVRQLAVCDSRGRTAAWTGPKCIPAAGHFAADNFSVQANLMLNDRVWPAMAEAFQNATGPLAERMLTALQAAQNAGGDIRGRQSAALVVVKKESTGKIWQDRLIDLRVDDHPQPVPELKRLLHIYRAYQHMNKGDQALEKNDVEGALREYATAEKMQPDNFEMKYWHAVSLANIGMIDDSLPIFKEVFKQDEHWWILTKRLPKVDLLKVNEGELNRILSQK
ncbi:MAG: DUF1028 domain-containing protein, partial [bacterium]